MKQQILVIHGGDVFETREEYLAYIRNKEFSMERLRVRGWKTKLAQELEKTHEVFSPRMPCQDNARYSEWKIWINKILPLLQDNALLIGTSLGGICIAKYLSEETLPKKIQATFLVAAPFDKKDLKEALGDFVLPNTLNKLEAQAGEVFLYHSKDDPIVPFVDLRKYQKALPKAQIRIFEDRGHFNIEEFPEIVEDIKSL